MRLLPAICALLVLALCAGCHKSAPLPQQAGLVSDDLGVGISLLMPASSAINEAGNKGPLRISLITTDKLREIAGYDDKSDVAELTAIYYDGIPGDRDDPLAGRISEIRCFLNNAQGVPLTLLGQPIAGMGAEDMEALLGPASQRSDNGDGMIHLTYLFDPGLKDGNLQLRLVTSHHLDHSCYAFKLRLEPRQ